MCITNIETGFLYCIALQTLEIRFRLRAKTADWGYDVTLQGKKSTSWPIGHQMTPTVVPTKQCHSWNVKKVR